MSVGTRKLIWITLTSLAMLGCHGKDVSFVGHKLGETFAQFTSIEHPAVEIPKGVDYTGTVHCYDTSSLGDHCSGQRHGFDKSVLQFDNAHFTFVNGKLTEIETVGAGGIIGDSKQNWNWNLYLSNLKQQYGEPTKMTADDAVWVRGDSVVHPIWLFTL